GRRPTSAFVSADQTNLGAVVRGAGPGTVVELDPGASIVYVATTFVPIYVPRGVTIRGGRGGLAMGAEISTPTAAPMGVFDVRDPDVRITGLRLRGPSRSNDGNGVDARGVFVHDQAARLYIDHDDLSDWTTAAIWVQEDQATPECQPWDGTRVHNVHVLRNFIHNNEKQDAGYGVCTNVGGYPL